MASLRKWLSGVVIGLVRGYQWLARPILPRVCRFQPSCSDYMILAVQKHGPLKGAMKGVWRVCRCNPFCRGGEDWP